jgi:glycosyltransferase involved in cell wall biosynthesis
VSGSWLFGYVDALDRVGIRTVLVLWSREARRPHRRVHVPTGTVVWVLPATPAHWMARRLADALSGSGWWAQGLRHTASLVARYAATTPLNLARVLRQERCDAIVVQEYEYPRFDVCVLLGRLLRLPVFATHQGGKPPKSRIEGWVSRWTVPAAAGLLVGGRQEAKAVAARHRLPPGAVTVVPNPIDLREWTPGDRAAARAALDLPADVPIACWHGRTQVMQKGLDVLVEAWRLVCAERPGEDLRLLLCGTLRGDRGSAQLRRLISAADLRGVHWRDEYVTDRTVVRRRLAASDLFVFPSRHEGFAVTPMEAMACGRPVVACDAPGVVDLLDGGEQAGGVVVPRDDPETLAAAMGRLLDDRALAARLGEAARRAIGRHSPEAVGLTLATALHMAAPDRFPALPAPSPVAV